MSKEMLKTIVLTLLCMLCLSALGCDAPTKGDEVSRQYCRIQGKDIYFVSDEEKQAWKEPLVTLITRSFALCEENEKNAEYEIFVNNDETAIAESYRCGLLDITMDGVPELLVHPRGYYGSSGIATYFIFDISSGAYLGEMDGGDGESWCFYYGIETGTTDLFGRYWLRGGWSARDRYVNTLVYDHKQKSYREESYLRVSYEIEVNAELGVEGDPRSRYFIRGEEVHLDDYYAALDRFTVNYVCIPETAFQLISWDDVCTAEDDGPTRAEKMAEALVGLDQEFIRCGR